MSGMQVTVRLEDDNGQVMVKGVLDDIEQLLSLTLRLFEVVAFCV